MKSHFPTVELGKYVRQVSQRNRAEADIEVFSVTNSEGFTKSTDYFSKEVFSKDVSNYKVVRPGQFAYNPSRINVGSIDYLRHGSPVLVSPLYIVFEGDRNIHADYLLRYLKSDWGNAQIRSNTEGAVRDSLKFKGLESIKLPLPLLDDQIRIANLLDKVEELIAQRKQSLQQLDDLLKSVFLEMFGDPVINPKDWPDLSLGEALASLKYGPRFYNESYSADGIRIVRITDLNESGDLDFSAMPKLNVAWEDQEKFLLQPGDLIFARTGATVGKVALIGSNDPPAIAGAYFIVMRFKKTLLPLYVRFVLTSPSVRAIVAERSRQAAQPNFSGPGLRQLPMPIPPIEMQQDFAKIFNKVAILRAHYQQSLTDLEALYGALSQQAFKGELNLSRVSLPTDVPQPMSVDVASTPITEVITPTELVRQLVQSVEPQGRDQLLTRWFQQYLANTPPATGLSAVEMLEGAWQALQTAQLEVEVSGEEEEEEPPDLADYDALKALVFKALDAGELLQTFDDDRNRVALTKPPADWGTW
jgi:type I restriction enzyme S subunit